MSVLLREVVLAVRYGDASFAGESAGYVVLGAADAACAGPAIATLDSLSLSDEGTIILDGAPTSEPEAVRSLRTLLGYLLEQVRTPFPNLRRVVDRTSSHQLAELITELEAALVPVNRRAARRTLSRLAREALKSASRARSFAEVEAREETVPLRESLPENHHELMDVDFEICAEVEEEIAQSLPRQQSVPTVLTLSPPPLPVRNPSRLQSGSALQVIRRAPAWIAPSSTLKAPTTSPQVIAAMAQEYLYAGHPSDEFSDVRSHRRELWDPDQDETPTQVLADVAKVDSGASSGRSQGTLCAGGSPRSSPIVASPRRLSPVATSDSLIPQTSAAPRRTPSDIGDLLSKMYVSPQSSDELYSGLKLLSRVERSPRASSARTETSSGGQR